MKELDKDTVEISIRNLDDIASVSKEGNKYKININNNLDGELMWYFIFHEISHILNDEVEGNKKAHFFMEYEHVDKFALKAYIKRGFDKELIRNSALFEEKLENEDFKMIFEAWR